MAQDTHYKYLVVLLVPVTVCFVIVNWWGLKVRPLRVPFSRTLDSQMRAHRSCVTLEAS